MRTFLLLFSLCLGTVFLNAQTPVPMASQAGFSYTETFDDISGWAAGFASPLAATRFGSVAVSSTGSIPSATRVTTSSASFSAGTSGGVQKGTANIQLLSTGTTDNSSSVAFDFFMDFTGVQAGTLSFDWAVVFNSTGNRSGSLKVYASIDGSNFTEIPSAAVTNFVNNVAGSGSITSVALPATFNNQAGARLRFYYYNGSGGSTGSRPKISIDNLKVTAVSSTPCKAPTSEPTNLLFSNVTPSSADGSFTATTGTDEYLVVMSNNNALTSGPADGITYNVGDGLGDGVVVARGNTSSFSAANLSNGTDYYFFIYAVNSYCSGGPLYGNQPPLTGKLTTAPGMPQCSAPAVQASNLTLKNNAVTEVSGAFDLSASDGYLVLRTTSPTLSTLPVNGHEYIQNEALGNAVVVQYGKSNSFTATGLTPNSDYFFFVFSFNSDNCLGGPAFNAANPLQGDIQTLPLPACATPLTQPSGLNLTVSNNTINGTFTPGQQADSYLIIQSASPTLSALPLDNTDYTAGSTLGNGTVIAAGQISPGFLATGLSASTTYYYTIFAANKTCTGGTRYLTASPLTGNVTVGSFVDNNVYYGTWHSHSDYSDGNKDNPGYTPADDYLYAMNSQKMDYLGISEHNHFSSNNNPGNHVATYHQGTTQANDFTANNKNFVAMYGMEWGVISGGGHVVVYGDGMDELFGWETGSGGWGSSNNYDVFVAKNDYTGPAGLFRTILNRKDKNTFATLAHPNSTDFNNLANLSYNTMADSAIVGCAVESGPAFSTNTTYSDPSSPSYLSYYQKLLSKGYHLGPVIDHDNHNTTFGRTATTRTAILAPSLSKTELIKGMANMHFYATEDYDARVDFTINGRIMGSTFTDRNVPNINVTLTDPTTPVSNAVIKIMYGSPGSNVLPVELYNSKGGTVTYTDNNLANLTTGYYYADITSGTARIITSPIWYTRSDAAMLPVSFIGFFVQKDGSRVKLNWSTAFEQNSNRFDIERSADGTNWVRIGSVAAAGNQTKQTNYSSSDPQPLSGANYYRLKEVDNDGTTNYSEIKSVQFGITAYVSVTPNPVHDIVNVRYKNGDREITIQLLDNGGNTVRILRSTQEVNRIPVKELAKGLYYVRVIDQGNVQVVKILVE